MRRSFLNTHGVKNRRSAKTSAVVRMQIQSRTRGVAAHHSAVNQLCVPAVLTKGDSHRLAQALAGNGVVPLA
jgi:hypothetical protein